MSHSTEWLIDGGGWEIMDILNPPDSPIGLVKFRNKFDGREVNSRFDFGKMIYIDPHPVNVLPVK
jgi:hypothetical protein